MPATIKPKRGSGLPTSNIKPGELLVDTNNKRVYLGTGTTTADVIGSAAHGSAAGLIQFRGANSGEFLSSSLYGVKLSGSTPTSVFIGQTGQTPIPLDFYTQSGQITVFGFRSPSSISTIPTYYNTWNPTQINYVLPNNLPDLAIAKSRWMLYIDSWNGATSTFQLKWVNICNLCSLSVDTGGTSLGGLGFQGLYGQVLVTRAPTTNDDPDTDIYVTTADANALRYDFATNTIITPKVQATDTIESTGLVLKTGNTGKVKFVAQSFAGSEVTVTVPQSASGGTLISTNSKVGDLATDTWTNISAKISSGKRGTGDVLQAVSPLITTPTIETSLTLSGANPQIKASTTPTAVCDIFSDNFVDSVNLGLTATTVSIGQKSGTTRLVSDTLLCNTNIFTIGGLNAPTVDSNKDKGIQFRWHNGSIAKTGFFGYDDSSGKMIFVPDATITSDEVTAGDIGEINAKVEWANLLSVPSFATSSNNLGYFAATTSAQLAGVISDETGSGALVFGTSPSFTTGINAASTTMALFNTTATTINMGGAATAVNIGATGSGTVTIGHNLYVTNKIEASIKSFVIDHPTKQGKKLRYACLEGPENGVYVRGKLDGENTIVLPEYWVNLVDEETITVNLTGIDSSGYHTVKKIENNKITVQSSSGNVNCYYVVYGERKDVSKLVTEFE